MSRLSHDLTVVYTTKGKMIPLFALGVNGGELVFRFVNGNKEVGSITWTEVLKIIVPFARRNIKNFKLIK